MIELKIKNMFFYFKKILNVKRIEMLPNLLYVRFQTIHLVSILKFWFSEACQCAFSEACQCVTIHDLFVFLKLFFFWKGNFFFFFFIFLWPYFKIFFGRRFWGCFLGVFFGSFEVMFWNSIFENDIKWKSTIWFFNHLLSNMFRQYIESHHQAFIKKPDDKLLRINSIYADFSFRKSYKVPFRYQQKVCIYGIYS